MSALAATTIINELSPSLEAAHCYRHHLQQSSEPKWMSRMTPSRGPTSEIGVMQVPPRGSINAIVAIPLLISMWQRRNDQASALHHFLNK
jgi:hypothetical protein